MEKFEKEETLSKIYEDFDYSMFKNDRTDEPENSLTNNKITFNSDITAIPKGNKNNSHYQCSKCFFFPCIQIINKNEIKCICKCTLDQKEDDSLKNKCTEQIKGKIIKIKEFINEIKNFEDKKNINNIQNNQLRCSKHNHKFRYYCSNCHKNICKECFEYHLNDNCHLVIFDFLNYDIRKKKNKLTEFFYPKQNNNIQINKTNQDNNANLSELMKNSSIFQEDKDELENNIEMYKIKIEKKNQNVIIEENNPYYIKELFNIICNDYLNYPNYSHFFNIENIFRFMEKEMNAQKNFEISKNIDLKDICSKCIDMMTIVYKNDKNGIKLFSDKFVCNYLEGIYLEIDNKFIKIKNYHKFDNNKEEVEIKLYISKKIEKINLSYMFNNCINLKSINGISK